MRTKLFSEAVSRERRAFLAASGATLLAACAGRGPLGVVESTTEVPAPRWRAGDAWTYKRTDLYTKLDAGTLTREVVASGSEGVRIVTRLADGRVLDDAAFSEPGVETSGTLTEDGPITGRFNPPLRVYDFPLVSGKGWRQAITRTDSGGFRNYMTGAMRVEGWEEVRVGGRDYRAIILRRSYNLGPKDPFHGESYRHEIEWYAPELRGTARLQTNEWYWERRNDLYSGMMPGYRFLYELQSFKLA